MQGLMQRFCCQKELRLQASQKGRCCHQGVLQQIIRQTAQTTGRQWLLIPKNSTFNTSGVLLTLNIKADSTVTSGIYTVNFAPTNTNSLVNSRYAISNAGGTQSVAMTTKAGAVTIEGAAPTICDDVPSYQNTMTIYAKVRVEGSLIETDGSKLAAYKDNECRGVVTISTGPSGKFFQLTVGSEMASETGLKLKIYDAKTGKIYEIPGTFNFSINGTIGQISQPQLYDITNTVTQTIPLVSGWNWISFNTLPESPTLADVLKSYAAKDNDTIKTAGTTATYYGGTWYGMDSGIKAGVMYLLKAQSAGNLTIEGQAVSVSEGINIVAGWNWISFKPQTVMPLATALSSLKSSDNDTIKTAGTTATYYGGTWYGMDSGMKPGVGYLLKSALPGTLIYPASSARSKIRKSETVEYPSVPGWKNPEGMQYTMTIHAKIQSDDENPIESDGSILGAFKDDECRGTVIIADGPAGKWFQLTVSSNESSESGLVLKIYDAETGDIYPVKESFDFKADHIIGQIFDPHIYTTESDTDVIAGDTDSSKTVDLSDAILALKVLAGIGNLNINPDADVNKDEKQDWRKLFMSYRKFQC